MKVAFSSALALLSLFNPLNAAPTSQSSKSSNIIPGRYIVSLGDSKMNVQTFVNELQSGFESDGIEASISHVYDMEGFQGFAGSFDEAGLANLRSQEGVLEIEPDQIVRVGTVQNNPTWGLARVGSNAVSEVDFAKYNFPDEAGKGVTAYVIDTGCVPEHEEFEGRASLGKSFGYETSKDGNGHGTHVSGTIAGKTYGVAKQANVVCVKVLSDSGSGSFSDVIAGINWAAQDAKGKKAVANMSLGGSASNAIDKAVDAAIASGLPFAVAAGNSGDDACRNSPARVKNAVTVAASNKAGQQASFSNYGECVDIYAPGEDITSAWFNRPSITISGTSMASPHVAGVMALYLSQDGSLTPAKLADAIVRSAINGTIVEPSSQTPNLMAHVFMKKL